MRQHVLNVGQRIRAMRKQRRLSLRALAGQCQLSANTISLIERGENSPTVSSLHVLAQALGVHITDFFQDTHNDTAVVFVAHAQRLRTKGNGCFMESLGSGLRNQQLEPFLVLLPQEQTTDMMVHPGQEFVFCLEGIIVYHIGNQTYTLSPGDSVLFDATQPHCFCAVGGTPATMLLILHAEEGNHIACTQHLA